MPSTNTSGSSPEGLRPTEQFVVTDEQLRNQLTEGWALQGDHRTWPDPSMMVITEDGPRTARQTAAYFVSGVWDTMVHNLCDEPACLLMSHLTTEQAEATKAEDDRLAALVQRSTTTLADLYRKGKARGLLKAASAYGG